MPYVVKRGQVEYGRPDGVHIIYEVGEEVPAMKGALSDMVEAGSVEWRDSRVEANEKRKAVKAKKAGEE